MFGGAGGEELTPASGSGVPCCRVEPRGPADTPWGARSLPGAPPHPRLSPGQRGRGTGGSGLLLQSNMTFYPPKGHTAGLGGADDAGAALQGAPDEKEGRGLRWGVTPASNPGVGWGAEGGARCWGQAPEKPEGASGTERLPGRGLPQPSAVPSLGSVPHSWSRGPWLGMLALWRPPVQPPPSSSDGQGRENPGLQQGHWVETVTESGHPRRQASLVLSPHTAGTRGSQAECRASWAWLPTPQRVSLADSSAPPPTLGPGRSPTYPGSLALQQSARPPPGPVLAGQLSPRPSPSPPFR